MSAIQFYFMLIQIGLTVMFLVAQLCPTLCNPMDCSPPASSVHGDSPGKNIGMGCHALLQGNLPNPRIEPRSPVLQVDSLPAEPPGKSISCCIIASILCFHHDASLFMSLQLQDISWGFSHLRDLLSVEDLLLNSLTCLLVGGLNSLLAIN